MVNYPNTIEGILLHSIYTYSSIFFRQLKAKSSKVPKIINSYHWTMEYGHTNIPLGMSVFRTICEFVLLESTAF